MFLTDIIQFVEHLFKLLYYIFMICTFLGKLIAQTIGYVWYGLCTVYNIVVPALIVLYEDSKLFHNDVCDILNGIWTFITISINDTIKTVTDCVAAINSAIEVIYNIVTERLLPFPILTLQFAKEVLILIGEGVWYIITLPLTISQAIGNLSVKAVNALLCRVCGIIEALYDAVLLMVTDFPVQAFIGLLLLTLAYLNPKATKVIYVCLWKITRFIYYRVLCVAARVYVERWRQVFHWLAGLMRQLLIQVAMAFVTIRARVLRIYDAEVRPFVNVIQTVWSFNQPSERPAERNNALHNSVNYARPSISTRRSVTPAGLCIICEDRQKSVALVPCGHICMCKQCTIQLSHYNSACPLCRQMFRGRLDVYF